MIFLSFCIFLLASFYVANGSSNYNDFVKKRPRLRSLPTNYIPESFRKKLGLRENTASAESSESSFSREKERKRSFSHGECNFEKQKKREDRFLKSFSINIPSIKDDNKKYAKLGFFRRSSLLKSYNYHLVCKSPNEDNHNVLCEKNSENGSNGNSSKDVKDEDLFYKSDTWNKKLSSILRRNSACSMKSENISETRLKRWSAVSRGFSFRRKSNANDECNKHTNVPHTESTPDGNDKKKEKDNYMKYATGGIFAWTLEDAFSIRIQKRRKSGLSHSMECITNSEEDIAKIEDLYIWCIGELNRISNKDSNSEDKSNVDNIIFEPSNTSEQNLKKKKSEELKRMSSLFNMYEYKKKEAAKKRLIRSLSLEGDKSIISGKSSSSNSTFNLEFLKILNKEKNKKENYDNISVYSCCIECIDN